MTVRFAKSLARLERRKQAMLDDLHGRPEAYLRFRPDPASWSAVDVLDHLQKSEFGILLQMRKHLYVGQPIAMADRLGSLFILTLFRLPSRVKIPDRARAIHPSSTATLADIEECWSKTRLDLAAFLVSVPSGRTSQGMFQHPVAGWMRVQDTLSFFDAHLIHHRYQLKRIERSWRRSQEAVSRA